MMDWGDYEPFKPGVFGPFHLLPRKEARAAFTRLMDARPERLDDL